MIDVVRILLACVFAVAGLAKLADLEGSRRALAGFGLRRSLSRPLGLALPLAELTIAGGLLSVASARYAAAAAAGVLVVFCAAIGAALARGRKPDCHCFGRLHSAPAGWGTLVRNVVLAGVAVVIAAVPAANLSWLALALTALAAAGGGQAVLWVLLLRRYGRALRHIDELEGAPHEESVEVGSPAPGFALPTVDGDELSLDELLAPEKPLLLVFTDTGCGACTALLPDVVRWQRAYADRLTLAVVGHGDAQRLKAAAEEHGLERLLLAPDRSLALAYGAYGTPSSVLVVDGHVATPVVYGADEITSLMEPSDWEPTTEELVHA